MRGERIARQTKIPPGDQGGFCCLDFCLGRHFAGAGAGAGAGAAFGIGAGAGAGAAPLAVPSTTTPLPQGSQQRRCRRRANKLGLAHGSHGSHAGFGAHVTFGQHAGFGAQHLGLGGQQASPVPLIASSKTILCIVVSSKVDLHPGNYFEFAGPPASSSRQKATRFGARN